jgi:hypothetical protein
VKETLARLHDGHRRLGLEAATSGAAAASTGDAAAALKALAEAIDACSVTATCLRCAVEVQESSDHAHALVAAAGDLAAELATALAKSAQLEALAAAPSSDAASKASPVAAAAAHLHSAWARTVQLFAQIATRRTASRKLTSELSWARNEQRSDIATHAAEQLAEAASLMHGGDKLSSVFHARMNAVWVRAVLTAGALPPARPKMPKPPGIGQYVACLADAESIALAAVEQGDAQLQQLSLLLRVAGVTVFNACTEQMPLGAKVAERLFPVPSLEGYNTGVRSAPLHPRTTPTSCSVTIPVRCNGTGCSQEAAGTRHERV